MRRSTALIAGLAAASIIVAGCGDTDDDQTSSTTIAAAAAEHDHDDTTPVAEGARRIEVTGDAFAFDPAEIRVRAGEDVAIVLTSEDLLHDFTVDELDVHVGADVDETATGGLRAGEPGRYTYYCTVAGHREAGMEGTLIVEET